jgi:uncharacterized protein YhbP (UPF0306 family)
MDAGPGEIEVAPHVVEYLRTRPVLTLATASAAAVPRATSLLYVSEGVDLFFWTHPESSTALQIRGNPAVAFTVDEYAEDWRQIKGVQGQGECRVVINPAEVDRVVEAFEAKFGGVERRRANVAFFRITPLELRFVESTHTVQDDAERRLGGDYEVNVVYSVFRDLPEHEVEALAEQLATVQAHAGDVIVRQGAPADKFFIIVDGEVEVVREDAGETRTVAVLRAGQFFGEMAILADKPRVATVRALTPTTLLTMKRDVFRSLVAQSLSTTQDFDRIIHERLEGLRAN